MLVNIACRDWVNPNDVSGIERDGDGEVRVYLRNGCKLTYSSATNADPARMAKIVNDACAKLIDMGN